MNLDRRLLQLARNPWLALCVTIFCGVAAGWLTIGQARSFSQVVDQVFLGGKNWEDARELMLLMLGLIGGRSLLAWMMEVSANSVAVRVKMDLRRRLLIKIETLGPAFTIGEHAGELASTVTEGVEALDAYFSQYLPQLVISSLVPLSILIFVFPLDPLSGVILLFTAPLIPLFMILIGKGAEKLTKRQFDTLGRLSAHFLESLQGITTLKQLGRSRDHIRSIQETSEKFRDVTLSVLRVTFLSALALELIATLSTAIIAVEIGLRLLHGGLPFDKALFLLVLAPEFYIPLRMLGLRFHAGMAGTAAARRIFAILDMESEKVSIEARDLTHSNIGERDPHRVIQLPINKLKIDNVVYTYPGKVEPALRGVSLEILPGQHIALVGPSGGGKSTLASLLLGFIEPTAGGIYVNGVPIRSDQREDLREKIAWVPQNPHLFHDTIAANLRVARADASEEELEGAVKAACLDQFIHSLPEGFGTIIGEEGVRLSGGQAQRLALARAYLRDAPILILDEPTSSVDPTIELLLQAATRRLMQHKMVITIAHRLNTVIEADLIVVLQAGSILESGTHSELMMKNGMYARMVGAMRIEGHEPGKSEINPVFSGQETETLETRPAIVLEKAPKSMPVQLVGRLISFIKGSWGWVGVSVLLGVLTIGASIGLMGTSSWLIATAAMHPSIADLGLAIVGVRFFGILRGISRYLERLASHTVTFNLLARLRTWFYKKLEPLAPRRLSVFRSADLLERIVANVDMLENFYGRVIAPTLVALVVCVGTAWYLGMFNLNLGGIYFGFSLALGLILPILTTTLGKKPGQELVRLRSRIKVKTMDVIQGLADLLSCERSTSYRESVLAETISLGQAQGKMAQVTGLSNAGGVFISHFGMWSVLAFSIPLVSAGTLEGVMLPVLALLSLASFEAAQPLPQAFQNYSTCTTAAARLFDIVEKEEGKSSKEVHVNHFSIPEIGGSIQARGLTFTYPGNATPALRDFEMDLEAGKRMAIVGPSGAGKSTLLNLLLRFWDTPPGCIRISGRDLMEYTEEEARRFFNVISQRTYLFHASIRENLLLAKPAASQAEIEQAVQLAGLQDFIQGLPLGYETVVGEHGWRLSGGERQRLAIARALLKHAPIYLLDEPTANLDPLMGKIVMDNILQVTEGSSVLLITHRLADLDKMDEIIFLENGRLIEKGSQLVLLDKNGAYRRMADIQARILRPVW